MRNALAIGALLIAALPGARPGAESDELEWGPQVDGLRLATAVSTGGKGEPQIRVTVNNDGDKPLLLPFAFATGDGISRYRLRLFVSGPGPELSFEFDGATILRGRFDPLVIPMAPHASYALDLPASKWRPRAGTTPLQALIKERGLLWVEWDCAYITSTAVPPLPCPLYGYPNPNQLVCWQGKLTSNRIALPK